MFHISHAEDRCLQGADLKKTDYIDDKDRCFNFSTPNREKGEFYSPNYPNHYPNNTKCTLRIEAQYGYLVQVDFLDTFKMENSPTCEYDRLVVRDGPFGYSSCKGVYCGHNFPPKITSMGQYLWLQFQSDGSIEYEGFRATYKFIEHSDRSKPPPFECFFERTGPSGKIGLLDIPPQVYEYARRHDSSIDCKWKITALPNWKIYMTIPDFELEKPNNCDQNYIEIFDRSQDEKSMAKFCGTSAEPQKTKSNALFVRYFSQAKNATKTKFVLTYTTIRDLDKGETCDPFTEFDCNDQSCIHLQLKCDGRNDCKYGNDEDTTLCKKETNAHPSDHMIIILVVFFILVITMCASISISCYNKVQERRQRAKEYKARKSKEASVEGNVDRTVVGIPSHQLEAALAPHVGKTDSQRQIPAANFVDDDESSDGCYVPEIDFRGFAKHPNGGESIPRGPESRSVSRGTTQPDLHRQQQQYPYISQSIDSLQSDTLVPPAPPPVPVHLKERREASEQPSHRRAVAEVNKQPSERRFEPYVRQPKESNVKTPTDSKSPQKGQGRWPPESRQVRNPSEDRPSGPGPGPGKGLSDPDGPRNAFLRGPLESGAPRSGYGRSPAEIGVPKFGTARVNPDGPRGPLARGADRATPLATFKAPESYGDSPYLRSNRTNPYRGYRPNPQEEIAIPQQFRTQAMVENSEIDSSRPDSVDSTQSAPDVIANR